MKPLSAEQIELARRSVIENARRLFSDAELLFEHGRHSTALSLAVLASEECAKVPMLVGAWNQLASSQPVDWPSLGRRLTNHNAKLTVLDLCECLSAGVLEDRASLLMRLRETRPSVGIHPLNRRKQSGFYVSLNAGIVLSPADVLDAEGATRALQTVRALIGFFDLADYFEWGQRSEPGQHMDGIKRRMLMEALDDFLRDV